MADIKKIIDVHAHFGSTKGFPQTGKESELISPSFKETRESFERAGIRDVLVSPAEGIYPYGDRTIPWANEHMCRLVQEQEHIYQWVVIHPDIKETYAQAERMLAMGRCAGIKIHPDAHGYRIQDRGDEIFEFACRFGAVVETHTGGPMSPPEDFVEFAEHFPNVRILLSHLGNNWDGDVTHQVRALVRCRCQNLFTDVSSTKSILPGLIEWAVKEVGARRILFGTDYPLHDPAMMAGRVETAAIRPEEKEWILYRSAGELFGIEDSGRR